MTGTCLLCCRGWVCLAREGSRRSRGSARVSGRIVLPQDSALSPGPHSPGSVSSSSLHRDPARHDGAGGGGCGDGVLLPRQRLPLLLPGDPVVVRPQPQGLDGQTDVGFQSGNAPRPPPPRQHGKAEPCRQSPSGQSPSEPLPALPVGKRFVCSPCWVLVGPQPTAAPSVLARPAEQGFTLCSDREQPCGAVNGLHGLLHVQLH